MFAVLINVATVLIGSTIGLIFGSRIKENYTQGIMTAIALCTFVIGVQSAVQTSNILIVMICLVLGTVIGVWLKLDDRMNGASDRIDKIGQRPVCRGVYDDDYALLRRHDDGDRFDRSGAEPQL